MPFQIVKPGTHINFIGRWRVCVALSVALIMAGLLSIPIRGFRLGIDFAGGTEVQVRFVDGEAVDEGDVRAVVEGVGIEGASVIRYGQAGDEFLVKFPGAREITPEVADTAAAAEAVSPGGGAVNERTDRILALEAALERELGTIALERVEFVGPKVGAELREDGLRALGIACLLILGYIALRFSTRFAPGAVVALIHDVGVTASLWILLGLEFDLRVLAALLAIIGYSLNDTIIVYDRIRENLELRTSTDLVEVLNLSVNQTLSRTLLTSITTLLAVLSLLLLGGAVIRPFALAMVFGVLVGTYSSIYIAGPILMWLEGRFGVVAPGSGGGRAKAPARATGAPTAPAAAPAGGKRRKGAKGGGGKGGRQRKPARA